MKNSIAEELSSVDVERRVRLILHALPAGSTLSTAELSTAVCEGLRIAEDDADGRRWVPNILMKLTSAALCDIVPEVAKRGFNTGKTIKRRVWHHIDSPDLPERPITAPSSGAASSATSLQAQLADHNARINELAASVADLQDQVQALKKSVDALQIPANIAAYI